jgi:hypothetical protein
LQKPIILLLEEEKEYCCLIKGLYTIANAVTLLTFRQEEDYLKRLESYFDN